MSIADKLTQIAENTPKVYEAGRAEGIELGKQAEYDAFWDAFQRNGKRPTYQTCFNILYWSGNAYNPKYPIAPTAKDGANAIFAWNTEITDTKVPITIYGNVGQLFTYNYKLVRIPKLIISDSLTNINGMFDLCYALVELNIEGVIDISGINLQWSTKLSRASVENIINCLSTTTSGLSITLSETAVDNAFETGEGSGDGSMSEEWVALIGTKSNWTVSLV